MDEQNKKQNILIPSLKANRKMNFVQKRRAFPFSSTDHHGSMTVEAAMVLPIFLFFMMTLLMGIEIVRLQSNLFAGLSRSEAVHMKEQIHRVILDQIPMDQFQEDTVQEYLDGQENGKLCLMNEILAENKSDVQGNGKIQIRVEYVIKPFIYWLPIGNASGGLPFQDELLLMTLMVIVVRLKGISQKRMNWFLLRKAVHVIIRTRNAYPYGYRFRRYIAGSWPECGMRMEENIILVNDAIHPETECFLSQGMGTGIMQEQTVLP